MMFKTLLRDLAACVSVAAFLFFLSVVIGIMLRIIRWAAEVE